MQGAHHVLHLILPTHHLATDRLSELLGGHGKRFRYLLLFTPVMLPLHYGPPMTCKQNSAVSLGPLRSLDRLDLFGYPSIRARTKWRDTKGRAQKGDPIIYKDAVT